MPDTYPFTPPAFLLGQSADEIHSRMLAALPAGIDKSEGNIPWDFTRPAALEKAEFVEFALNETIKLIFPQWAYAEWLDLHGEKVNCLRRAANHASGKLLVTGSAGTVIPSGYQFATPAGLTASVLFETLGGTVLEGVADGKGQVTAEIDVRAVKGGLAGNVAADTIKLMASPISEISYVTNPEPMTGGTDTETDEDYAARILEVMRNSLSMTGCVADYIRWAKEVAAVGHVVVEPEWDDPTLPEHFHYLDAYGGRRCAGAVRLIIADSNGMPANQQILDAVYLHIAGIDEYDINRKMPIGAHLTVVAPEDFRVDISARLLLEEDESIEAVVQRFKQRILVYWAAVANDAASDYMGHEGCIRWVQVGAILAKTDGVRDYTGLTINGTSENIPIAYTQYPVTGEVNLYV